MLLVEFCEGGDLRMALNLDNNLHKVRTKDQGLGLGEGLGKLEGQARVGAEMPARPADARYAKHGNQPTCL